jgi:hypothetical protein
VRSGLLFCVLFALEASAARESPEQYFDRRVVPILTRRCLGCHNEELNNGGISFLDRATLLKGGSRGPAIVPGNPEKSVLVRSLQHEGQLQMPPGPKLPAKEIKILTEWIRRGAVGGSKLMR